MLPLWVMISSRSKNIMLDGIIYDVVLFLACALAAGYFTGKLASFGIVQWGGVAMILLGLFLVKMK